MLRRADLQQVAPTKELSTQTSVTRLMTACARVRKIGASIGLRTKSEAPASRASRSVSRVVRAVSTITGIPAVSMERFTI